MPRQRAHVVVDSARGAPQTLGMQYSQPTWTLAGMTCAFVDPAVTRTTWSFEALKLLREFHVHLEDLKRQARQPSVLKLTRQRLETSIEPLEFQLLALKKLLEPLADRHLDQARFLSYLVDSPGPSSLNSNYSNLFRDWVWGEAENRAALDCVNAVVEPNHKWGRLAVLGAGACRLAYDLHQSQQPAHTTVSDFNPLLMLAAQKLVRGETLELVEFPLMPSEGAQFAIQQKLKAPAAVSGKFDFVLTDATNPGFERETFDTVLTPWLIDVVKMDLADFLPVLNQFVPEGGSWINFGPLGFNNSRVASHYAIEEVRYLIKKFGFEIKREKFERIPYMHNPSSNSHRLERVWTVHAVKTKSVDLPAQIQGDLYSWEANPDEPVDIPVKELNLVEGHRFNAEVLALVDGKRSLNEIVQLLVKVKNLTPAQASHIVTQILYNTETVSQRNPLRG